MKTHYDTLGVSQHATKAEIKAAFRKLSLETHPDVATSNNTSANVQRFQQIAEAHGILSDPYKRRIYDRELHHQHPFANELRHYKRDNASRYNTSNPQQSAPPFRHSSHSSFMHEFFDGMGRPRNILLGLTIGVSAVMAFRYFGSTSTSTALKDRGSNGNSTLVEAWYNPQTKQYEPPAPWDPTYKKLKPTLQLVPRHNVRPSHK